MVNSNSKMTKCPSLYLFKLAHTSESEMEHEIDNYI
jgi:hypothetical protein